MLSRARLPGAWALICAVAVCLSGCGGIGMDTRGDAAMPASPPPFALLGTAHIASDLLVDGTRVGGLSGVDQRADGEWILISDDRSQHAPARFYVASLALDGQGIGAVRVHTAVTLQRADGQPYPPAGSGSEAVDPESIRVDPRTGALWWSSEGDAATGAPQAIRRAHPDGRWSGELVLPQMLLQRADPPSGPRANQAFEALAWNDDGSALWAATEGPLLQDGPLPDAHTGAAIRFSLIDRDGGLRTQRLYRTEPVVAHAPGLRAENGISEILGLGGDRMLVMERSVQEQADGRFFFGVKLFCARLAQAAEVSALPSLAARSLQAAPKRLVLDLTADAALAGRNVEGMAWGPVLPDGRATLLLVSDNNFIDDEATTLALYATQRTRSPAWTREACGG